MNHPRYIVLHTLAFEGDADIDRVREWHVEGNGWNDVGYHYLVRRSGEVQQGRDEDEIGAHARGYNSQSIGIALEGHGDYERHGYEQILALFRLIDNLCRQYAIPPHRVIGHRETGSPKTCPGKLIDMDALRALLFEYMTE